MQKPEISSVWKQEGLLHAEYFLQIAPSVSVSNKMLKYQEDTDYSVCHNNMQYHLINYAKSTKQHI